MVSSANTLLCLPQTSNALQNLASQWQSSSRKTLSQAVKCYAHPLVLWIYCLNLHKTQHRASTWEKARKQHKHGFSSYLCRLPNHCSASKPYATDFSLVCQNIPLSTAFSLGYRLYSQFSRDRKHLPYPRPLAGQWTTVMCLDLPGVIRIQTVPDTWKQLRRHFLEGLKRCVCCPAHWIALPIHFCVPLHPPRFQVPDLSSKEQRQFQRWQWKWMLKLLETIFLSIFFRNTTLRDLQVSAKNMQRRDREGSVGSSSSLLQWAAKTDGKPEVTSHLLLQGLFAISWGTPGKPWPDINNQWGFTGYPPALSEPAKAGAETKASHGGRVPDRPRRVVGQLLRSEHAVAELKTDLVLTICLL